VTRTRSITPAEFVRRHTLARRNPPARRRRAVPGRVLGVLIELALPLPDGRECLIRGGDATQLVYAERARSLRVRDPGLTAVMERHGVRFPCRPRVLSYTHAHGGDDYTHDFERGAVARFNADRGEIVITGVAVKPFIEG
jgi:hypothetical protein